MKRLLFLIGLFLSVSVVVFAQNDPGQQFQGFNLEGFDDKGAKAWEINGDTADVVGTSIAITNVVANSFGDVPMNVTAEQGTIDQTGGDVDLQTDVILTNERGAQLITESLKWSKSRNQVSTDDSVIITDQGVTVTGKGMQANPGLHTAKIQEDVIVRVNAEPKEDKPAQFVTITSEGPMVFDKLLAKATFEDHVVAVQEGRILKSDRMEVFFDETMNQINDIVCIGNVEILQGENKTYAQRAVFKAGDEKVVLTGRPKLILATEGRDVFATPGN